MYYDLSVGNLFYCVSRINVLSIYINDSSWLSMFEDTPATGLNKSANLLIDLINYWQFMSLSMSVIEDKLTT